jgi:carbamate kinase
MTRNLEIPDRILVAIGGNATHPQEIEGTSAEQKAIAAGSMGSKVEAAIRFLEGGGERVIIAHVNDLMPALRGEAGTLIVADDA